MTTKPNKAKSDNAREEASTGRNRGWFKKGQSGNPGGRPRVLADVQELARQKSPKALDTLEKIMLNEKAPAAARVAAANGLLDRGYGRPTQPVAQMLAQVKAEDLSDEELAGIVSGAKQNGNGETAH